MFLRDAAMFALVFVRVSTVCLFLPGFGESTLSMRIKVVLGLVFGAITFVSLPASVSLGPDQLFITSLFAELATGLCIGLAFRLLVLCIQTAGTIAAQSTSLSQIMGNIGVDPMPAMGHVLVLGAICLAVTTGLHTKAAAFLILSYEVFPIGLWLLGADVAEWGVKNVSYAFQLAFTLAAPFVILSVLYNVVLGVINKAMPQLMVAFVGAPFITFGGLFLLFATAPIILQTWLFAFEGLLANPLR